MARGQKRSTQELLNDVIQKRADRKARFDKADGVDAVKERELREAIVRADVTARHLAALDDEVAAELAKLDAPQDVVDETGREQFQNA